MSHGAVIPTIVFGAFDRHNFGDLLFARVAEAMLPGHDLRFCGLLMRDLRAYGGHKLAALTVLAEQLRDTAVNIFHAGGELLACDAWEAAVMLLDAEQARQAITGLDDKQHERQRWAREMLGISAQLPYMVPRDAFAHVASIIYNAVGGASLKQRHPAMQAEAFAKLKEADAIGARERHTFALLQESGLQARLLPDSAVMVAELFGDEIAQHARKGEPADLHARFGGDYLAVQFSADFGDDATLAEIAAQLDLAAAEHEAGIVLFRAGAAPWHDSLEVYRRMAARMTAPVALFESLHIWDICALIAGSRGYCGSSLHGRIVAMAYARPRVNITRCISAGQRGKQGAYAATWEIPGLPCLTEASGIADSLRQAMAADPRRLTQLANRLVAEYRQGFATMSAALDKSRK